MEASSSFQGQRVELLHIRSRIYPVYIFIVDCSSPYNLVIRHNIGDWRGGGHYRVRLQETQRELKSVWNFKLALFFLFTWKFHCSFIMEQLFWDDSFGCEKDCEVVTKSTSFVKIFWKFKGHLFFECFSVCIYCIDSVTRVTDLKSDSHLPKKIVLCTWLKAL